MSTLTIPAKVELIDGEPIRMIIQTRVFSGEICLATDQGTHDEIPGLGKVVNGQAVSIEVRPEEEKGNQRTRRKPISLREATAMLKAREWRVAQDVGEGKGRIIDHEGAAISDVLTLVEAQGIVHAHNATIE